MKKLVISIFAGSMALLSVPSSFAAQELVASNNSALTNICMSAISNNKASFNAAVKSAKINKHEVADTVLCNGRPITQFVKRYGKNATVMNQHISGSSNSHEQESEFELVASNNSSTTKICIAATQARPVGLMRAIRNANLRKQQAVEMVKCNGEDLVNFIAQYHSDPIVMNDFITNGKYSLHLSEQARN